jgi:hypothetical protein
VVNDKFIDGRCHLTTKNVQVIALQGMRNIQSNILPITAGPTFEGEM